MMFQSTRSGSSVICFMFDVIPPSCSSFLSSNNCCCGLLLSPTGDRSPHVLFFFPCQSILCFLRKKSDNNMDEVARLTNRAVAAIQTQDYPRSFTMFSQAVEKAVQLIPSTSESIWANYSLSENCLEVNRAKFTHRRHMYPPIQQRNGYISFYDRLFFVNPETIISAHDAILVTGTLSYNLAAFYHHSFLVTWDKKYVNIALRHYADALRASRGVMKFQNFYDIMLPCLNNIAHLYSILFDNAGTEFFLDWMEHCLKNELRESIQDRFGPFELLICLRRGNFEHAAGCA